MQQNLYNDLKDVLSQDASLMADGVLLKNMIIERGMKADAGLIKLLLQSAPIKKHFFTDVDGVLVFNQLKFQQFVNSKFFLADSYTAFANKVGLLDDSNHFVAAKSDVVLAWPYKDCVLEGGQTKDDAKRDEVFWNETLAPDEIDWLLHPKALTNAVRHDKDGRHDVGEITDTDNLIIKGNNLLAMHTIKKRYGGKVKLIYIDPPYNTGNDSFKYNDRFNHSTWLTFMKNRLEVAKTLLADDGSIWLSIDADESHYLKILCDEVFGRENFIDEVIWQRSYAPINLKKTLSRSHDAVLVYAKNKNIVDFNKLERTEKQRKDYKNPDNDPRGDWKLGNPSVGPANKKNIYEIYTPTGRKLLPPKGRSWLYSQKRFEELKLDNRIWFGPNNDSMWGPKLFISEVSAGIVSMTLWTYQEVGHNQDAAREMKALGFGGAFSTTKPEKLIQRIIHIATKEGDLVLDFFSGSGTTAAVAHKMGRQWIAIEQMDYIHELPEARLIKVIEGEQGGISKAVNWQGGGSFVYCELAEIHEKTMRTVRDATTTEQLQAIWQHMQHIGFLSYKVNEKDYPNISEGLQALSLEDQKRFLIEMLDKNVLYVPHHEMEDKTYGLSDADIALNKAFFNAV